MKESTTQKVGSELKKGSWATIDAPFFTDYYQALGVDEKATVEELKAAYVSLGMITIIFHTSPFNQSALPYSQLCSTTLILHRLVARRTRVL